MLDWLKEADMATRLETAIARVIAEGKSAHLRKTCPVAAATRARRGEGGKDSTLDVAKAIASYATA
jgi:hypothetical protein